MTRTRMRKTVIVSILVAVILYALALTSIASPDTEPPTTPGTAVAQTIADTSMILAWSASTDVVGVDHYRIFQDEQWIMDVAEPSASISSLSADTVYAFRVSAVDAEGNESGLCEPLEVSTLLTKMSGITYAVTSTSCAISWAQWQSAVTYDLKVDGTIQNGLSINSYLHENIQPNSSHTYEVRVNTTSNHSIWSDPISTKTLLGKPRQVSVKAMDTLMDISWDAVPDASSYELYVDGTTIGGIQTRQYRYSGLTPNTIHTIKVRGLSSENTSDWSENLTCSTKTQITVGNIIQNTTWSENCVYVLNSSVTVLPGIILDIGPDTVVKCMPGSSMIIQGKLQISAPVGQEVVFTAYKDIAYGGTGIPANADYWNGLHVKPTGEMNVAGMKVLYAGKYLFDSNNRAIVVEGKTALARLELGFSVDTGIYAASTSAYLSIENSWMHDMPGKELVINSYSTASFSIQNNRFERGNFGIYLHHYSAGTITLSDNQFDYCTTGVQINQIGTNSFHMQRNSIKNYVNSPIWIELSGIGADIFPGITDNDVSSSKTNNDIVLVGSPVTNLTLCKSRYILNSSMTVPINTEFSLIDGAVMRVGASKQISVNGKMNVLGSKSTPVVITSVLDKTYAGVGFTSTNQAWSVIVKNTGDFLGSFAKLIQGGTYYNGSYAVMVVEGQLDINNVDVIAQDQVMVPIYDLYINSTKSVRIESCSFVTTEGDAVYNKESNETTIIDSRFVRQAKAGIAITNKSTDDLAIQGCTISGWSIGILNQTTGAGKLLVENNTLTGNYYKGIEIVSFGIGQFLIRNNTITGSKSGLYVDLSGLAVSIFEGIVNNTLKSNFFKGGEANYYVLAKGPSQNMTIPEGKYLHDDVSGALSIAQGKSLTLSPGVVLLMKGYVVVNGTLNAVGTESKPISIVSYADPLLKVQGEYTSADHFFWGMTINSTGTVNGNHLVIHDGLRVSAPYPEIYVSGTLNLINSEISRNWTYAGTAGIQFNTDIAPVLKYNSFLGNPIAINNLKSATMTIDARYNYWGNYSSPSGKVTAGVDYTPWLGSKLNVELQFGVPGINAPSGNFSRTSSDMGMKTAGFDVNINRTYNSGDEVEAGILGKGWTFGYQGSIHELAQGSGIYKAVMPNGSIVLFTRNSDGSYTSQYSHDKLVKAVDGGFLLTTKDQMQYRYDDSGKLSWIADKNDNKVTLGYNAQDQLTSISDPSGRSFVLGYLDGKLSTITDPMGHVGTYAYAGNQLVQFTNPMGEATFYTYDAEGLLSEIRNNANHRVDGISYVKTAGENYGKVDQHTDTYGNVFTYSYDTINRKTTVTDSNNRAVIHYYDSSLYVTGIKDAEGKMTSTAFFTNASGVNQFGDIKSETNRNGNKTQYIRDSQGNPTRITNPDLTFRVMTYDGKNNLTSLQDEIGHMTYFTYDPEQRVLLSEAKPLNGTDVYVPGTNDANFALTSYSYYSEVERIAAGYAMKGLLKSTTDPEGGTAYRRYDTYGNLAGISDPETGLYKSFASNLMGFRTMETSARGFITTYELDALGRVERMTQPGAAVTRTVYDADGNIVQEIRPNQYRSADDQLAQHSYSGNVGTRRIYLPNGLPSCVTDAANHETTYAYDLYGNKTTETLPNGAVYRYEYDVMNRPIAKWFRDDAISSESLLQTWNYEILADGKTRETVTRVMNDTEAASVVLLTDKNGREIQKTQPDGTAILTTYLANGLASSVTDAAGKTTYFKYDGLNRLTEQWTPFDAVSGQTRYAYQKIVLDKCDRTTELQRGKEPVALYGIPPTVATKGYVYLRNGKVSRETDSDGRRTDFSYDADGAVSRQDLHVTAADVHTTEFANDDHGKPTIKTVWVRKGDMFGQSLDDAELTSVSTSFTYDGNGNLKTMTTPDGVCTTYQYNALDQATGSSYPMLDEYGQSVLASRTRTLAWDGQPISETDAKGHATSYSYDGKGQLIKKQAPDQGITAYWYDQGGRKIAEVSPENYDAGKSLSDMCRKTYVYDLMGRVLKAQDVWLNPSTSQWETIVAAAFLYDANGNITKKLDALGYEAGSGVTHTQIALSGYGTEYTYNSANLCLTERDAVNKERNLAFSRRYTYDALGRKTTEEDVRGTVTSFSYNDNNLLMTKSILPVGSTAAVVLQSNTWDLSGNQLSQTDANGNETIYTYTAFNKVRSISLPGDASIAADQQVYQYDANQNVAFQRNAMGDTRLAGWDHDGRIISETTQDSNGGNAITTSKTWDLNGNLRFSTNGNGTVTSFGYDTVNRLHTETTTVSGITMTTTHAWDKNGNELSITDWRGNTQSSTYDSLNRLIARTDAYDVEIEHLEYNHANLQTTSENALGQRTLFVYDHNNRLLSTTDPASHVTSQTYDNSGNIATKTDGRNQVTTYTYDIQNRLVQVKNAKNEITGYTLDGNRNRLIQTDGNGHETLFEYNVRNLPTRRIDHGGRTGIPGSYVYDPAKTETYTYDAAGRITGKTDRKGVSSTWQYDCHGRIVTETIGGVSVGKTWDDNGNLLTLTDSTGTTTCSYDALNRILTKQAPNVGTLTYGWNRTAGLQSGFVGQRITDSAGNVTDTILDRMGRIARVVAGTHTATYAYTVTGQQESVTYETGCHEDYTYTADGLLETLTNKRADNTVIDSYAYTYDAAHNQTSKVDAKGTTGFTYDSLNRLLTLSEQNGKSTAYTYDAAGNRLTQTTSLGGTTTVETSTCNEQNRLTTLTTRVNGTLTETRDYSWDNAGNLLLTTANGTNVQENTYDARNQLVSTTMAGMQMRNVYNGEGLRVSKRTNGTLERYLLDGDRVVLELAENGTTIGRNVYGISLVMRQSGGNTYQFLYNGHADVTALVLPNGQIAGTWYYDAFGVPTEHTGVDSPYTYAGYRYDAETGLYYLNARMYDPYMARFLQEDTYRGDPNDPLSLNLYAYCSNNPITYTDPTGHWQQGDEKLNQKSQDRVFELTNQWLDADKAYNGAKSGGAPSDVLLQLLAQRNSYNTQAKSIRNNTDNYKTDGQKYLEDSGTIQIANGAFSDSFNSAVGGKDYNAQKTWESVKTQYQKNTNDIVFKKGFDPAAPILLQKGFTVMAQTYGYIAARTDDSIMKNLMKAGILYCEVPIKGEEAMNFFRMQAQIAGLDANGAEQYAQAMSFYTLGKIGEGFNVAWNGIKGYLNSKSPFGNLGLKIEENATRQLAKLEKGTPDAHYFSRHGAGTTLEEQYIRATTGFTPDGFAGRTVDSSRFLSNQAQLNAVQRADTIYRQTGNTSFSFNFGEVIGEGYAKGGGDLIRTTNVQAVYRNGHLYTLYPKLSPVK